MFVISDFIGELQNNVEVQALVGTYKGFPAIGNLYDDQPNDTYISICELSQGDYRFTDDGCFLRGVIDFDVKIVGRECIAGNCMKKSEIRQKYLDLFCILRGYTSANVANITITDSSSTLFEGQRPYIAMTIQVFFV